MLAVAGNGLAELKQQGKESVIDLNTGPMGSVGVHYSGLRVKRSSLE